MSVLSSLPPRRVVVDALVILLLGVALGMTVNYRLVLSALEVTSGARNGAVTVPATSRLPTPIELTELRRLVQSGVTLLDARSALLYDEGHLPGAISLPLEEVQAGERPLPTRPKEQTIVVYCGGYGCDDSFTLATLLSRAGYEDLRVFEGGYPQWDEARLPIEKGRR